mgnify:FL=1
MNSDNKQPYFFGELGSFMKPYGTQYGLSVAVSVAAVASGLAAYAFAGIIAGKLFSGNAEICSLMIYAALAAVCRLLNGVFINTSTWISHHAAYHTLSDIRKALIEKLVRLPMGYFEENGSGRLKAMLTDHIEGMERTLAHMLPELTANLLAPAAMMIWSFFIDWRLALCMLIWIIIGFSATGGMMKNYAEKYAGQIAAMKSMNQAVTEYVGGIEVIKNFGRADECYGKFKEAVYGHAEYNINWQKETQIYSSLGMAIAPFSVFPVLIAGVIFYNNGTLAPETFFMMILLSLGIFRPLMQAMSYFDQLAQMGTNAKEIKDILNYSELKRGNEEISGADIELSDVTFSYSGEEEPAADHISVKVPSGTMLALVGPSGSGKSTAAKLITGYWDADGGNIFIGGKSISEISQQSLNKNIAYVDQDTFLFDTSIMENIRMGDPSASDDEVIKAAKAAGCDDFIRALPQGYMTTAGAAGGRLSGGERQRIAIARAMMKNAPIMILDEATASSDPENEASIQTALSAAARGRTLVVIAHRLSTVMNAEQIAYVKSGRIEAVGTHTELLEKCPDYAKQWALSEG